MKTVKENFVQSKYSTKKYWGHANTHGRRSPDGETVNETPRANPDSLDESMGMYEIQEADKEVQGRVRKLLDIAKQILTDQQYKVFVLVAVKEPAFTEREAAKVMGISRARAHQLWTVAREKLQVAYDKRTV